MGMLCNHPHQTTPRRDDVGEYRRCLECGERLAWSWPDDFPIHPPKLMQARVTSAGPTLVRRPVTAWEQRRKSA